MAATGLLVSPHAAWHFVQNFRWHDERLPLTSKGSMITIVLAYLAMIGMGRQIFSKPARLPQLVPAAHNLVLCIGSLVMFLGTAWEITKVHRCWAACSRSQVTSHQGPTNAAVCRG